MPLPPMFMDDTTLFAAQLNAIRTYLQTELEIPSGLEAGRPTGLGAADRGRCYFNVEAAAFEVWDGTKWVGNAQGVTILLAPQAAADNTISVTPNDSAVPRYTRASFGNNRTLSHYLAWDVVIPETAPDDGTMTFTLYVNADRTNNFGTGGVRWTMRWGEIPVSAARDDDSLSTFHSQSVTQQVTGAGWAKVKIPVTTNLLTRGALSSVMLSRESGHAQDSYPHGMVLRYGTITVTR